MWGSTFSVPPNTYHMTATQTPQRNFDDRVIIFRSWLDPFGNWAETKSTFFSISWKKKKKKKSFASLGRTREVTVFYVCIGCDSSSILCSLFMIFRFYIVVSCKGYYSFTTLSITKYKKNHYMKYLNITLHYIKVTFVF